MRIKCLFIILSVAIIPVTTMMRPTPAEQLLAAYKANDVRALEVLISSGVPVDTPISADRSTILIAAACSNNEPILHLALQNGANVNKANDDAITPLFMAAHNGHFNCVNALINAGADPNKAAIDGTTPLSTAAQYGHFYCVDALLTAGADRNKARHDGTTPLSTAALHGHFDCVNALIDARAKRDIQTVKGTTLLHHAAYNGHDDIVSLLRSYDADQYRQDSKGFDAFAYAIRSNNPTEITARLNEGPHTAGDRVHKIVLDKARQTVKKKSLHRWIVTREIGKKRIF